MNRLRVATREYWINEFEIGRLEEEFKTKVTTVSKDYKDDKFGIIEKFRQLLLKKRDLLIEIGYAQKEELVNLDVVDLMKYKELRRRLG